MKMTARRISNSSLGIFKYLYKGRSVLNSHKHSSCFCCLGCMNFQEHNCLVLEFTGKQWKKTLTNTGPHWNILEDSSPKLTEASSSLWKGVSSVRLLLQGKVRLSFHKWNPILRQSETLQVFISGGYKLLAVATPCYLQRGRDGQQKSSSTNLVLMQKASGKGTGWLRQWPHSPAFRQPYNYRRIRLSHGPKPHLNQSPLNKRAMLAHHGE